MAASLHRDDVRRSGTELELVERAPFLDELRIQAAKTEVLGGDGEDVPHTGGRERVDACRSEGMCATSSSRHAVQSGPVRTSMPRPT